MFLLMMVMMMCRISKDEIVMLFWFDKSVQDTFNCQLYVLNVFESDFVSVLCKDYDHDCSANLMWIKVNGIGCDYGLSVLLMNHLPVLLDASLSGSVECASEWRPEGPGFDPRKGRQHFFLEIDHELISVVILSLPLIQEGQLSVSGKRMCTVPVNCLED